MATIRIDKNVMVPLRDGVRLATDVYRLQGVPAEPVLLRRTPYDKERAVVASSVTFDIVRTVQADYAVMVQDTRGRFACEGAFIAILQEGSDGANAIAGQRLSRDRRASWGPSEARTPVLRSGCTRVSGRTPCRRWRLPLSFRSV